MTGTPVYGDTRLRVLATALAAQHIEQRILMPCHKKEFVRLVLAVVMKIASEYERKLRAKETDLDMVMKLNIAYGAQTRELRQRIAELEQTLAEVPADAWREMVRKPRRNLEVERV